MPISTSRRGELCNVAYLWQKSQRNFLDSSRILRGMVKRAISNRNECLEEWQNRNCKYFQRNGGSGFCGIWRFCDFPEHSGGFFAFLGNRAYRGEKKIEEQTSETVRGSALSNCLAVYGGPEIMATDKDSRFDG